MSGVNDWTPIGTGLDNENIAKEEVDKPVDK